MATLYITEFDTIGSDAKGAAMQIATVPPVAMQTPITLTPSSAQSAALNNRTRMIRVFADVDCFIAVATNPTATTSSIPVGAYAPEYFNVPPGASLKIAGVIA